MVLRAREVKLQPGTSQWNAGSLLWVSRCLRKSIMFLHLANTKPRVWVVRQKVKKCMGVKLSFGWCDTCTRSNHSCMASRCCGGILCGCAERRATGRSCHTAGICSGSLCHQEKERAKTGLITLLSCWLSTGLRRSLGHQSVSHCLLRAWSFKAPLCPRGPGELSMRFLCSLSCSKGCGGLDR